MVETSCVDVTVAPGGRLSSDELDRHLRSSAANSVTMDLSQLTFIDPAGLVSLAVVAERAVAANRRVQFRKPEDNDLVNYLARMRLGDGLDVLGISHDLPTVRERRLGHRLVELRRFDGQAGLESVVSALVETYIRDRPELVQPLYAALDEIAVNVLEHSARSHGYVALQRFDRTDDVAFAVGDSGIGLLRRLATTSPVPNDRVAVVRAAQMHVSSISKPGRGRGLGRVIGITGDHRGEVTLVSGTARGVFRRGNPDPQLSDLPAPHPGTLAHVRLSL